MPQGVIAVEAIVVMLTKPPVHRLRGIDAGTTLCVATNVDVGLRAKIPIVGPDQTSEYYHSENAREA
jgi:hypothetical protein